MENERAKSGRQGVQRTCKTMLTRSPAAPRAATAAAACRRGRRRGVRYSRGGAMIGGAGLCILRSTHARTRPSLAVILARSRAFARRIARLGWLRSSTPLSSEGFAAPRLSWRPILVQPRPRRTPWRRSRRQAAAAAAAGAAAGECVSIVFTFEPIIANPPFGRNKWLPILDYGGLIP